VITATYDSKAKPYLKVIHLSGRNGPAAGLAGSTSRAFMVRHRTAAHVTKEREGEVGARDGQLASPTFS